MEPFPSDSVVKYAPNAPKCAIFRVFPIEPSIFNYSCILKVKNSSTTNSNSKLKNESFSTVSISVRNFRRCIACLNTICSSRALLTQWSHLLAKIQNNFSIDPMKPSLRSLQVWWNCTPWMCAIHCVVTSGARTRTHPVFVLFVFYFFLLCRYFVWGSHCNNFPRGKCVWISEFHFPKSFG